MLQTAKRLTQSALFSVGLKIDRITFPTELSAEDRAVFNYVWSNGLTMASPERLFATLLACRHVARSHVEGDFVECGVWRGGNSIVAADVFKRVAASRSVHLFDTFAGMTSPTAADVSFDGIAAGSIFRRTQANAHSTWCYSSLDEVKDNFRRYNLLTESVRFVQGDVLESLERPDVIPERISVLRLDTDWYASTRKELEVLYPRLSIGGVLIVDDYGHWGGARQAVDEYFAERPRPFLQYIDYTGRSGIKMAN